MQDPTSPHSKRTKEGSFILANSYANKDTTNNTNQSINKSKPFVEKTIYRTQKFPEPFFDKENDNDSLNSDFNNNRVRSSQPALNRAKVNQSRRSVNSGVTCPNCKYSLDPRCESAVHHKRQQKRHNSNDVSWDNLGDKIEDWFEYAKTPDQRVVYRFLKDIKDEERDLDSAFSNDRASSAAVADRAQSLEDILDNLKKYRSKINKSARPGSNGLPTINNKSQGNDPNLNRLFESSTWRVMRHLKSADIRNKYPLPKANPDFHFRNATIFQTVGRPPKSTFLLHPDWV